VERQNMQVAREKAIFQRRNESRLLFGLDAGASLGGMILRGSGSPEEKKAY